MSKVSVVIPNWNGAKHLAACLDSLREQTFGGASVIVVDNGSTDSSLKLLGKYPGVQIIPLKKNHGFAAGVNAGIRQALASGAKYIALFNNDAVADKDWLANLVNFLDKNSKAGIVTSKILTADGKNIDSTGDLYTTWGLPYPRGRGEEVNDKYDEGTWVFAASGGASLYRAEMLEQIGIFDSIFFAYYEDVDISFRAQLAGWKVGYQPTAVVHHKISATSSQIKDFATYHTLKNLPLLFWKNVPRGLMASIWIRMCLIWISIALAALLRGQFWALLKGMLMSVVLWPRALWLRRRIQKNRKVSVDYINSIIIHDLPPNARRLRKLRGLLGH